MWIADATIARKARLLACSVAMLALAACATTPPVYVQYQPAPGSYFVVPVNTGETVAAVAERYQVDEEDLVAINAILDRDAPLRDGSIRVPAYGHLKDPRRQPRLAEMRHEPIESRALAAPRSLRNERGAERVPQPVARPERNARIETRELPKPRQGSTSERPSQPAPVVASRNEARKPGSAAPKQPESDGGWWNVFTPTPQPRPEPVSGHKFLWPVQGRLISAFGTSEGGERNDGINIQAKEGAPVRAADAGTVTYVGNELKGYGNLVLIRHDNGFVSAYAHSESVTVARGERVTRGQVIAYAGATGDVTQPQLHFELRLNTKPVDPTPYMMASN